MSNFAIGISGLDAARKGLDVIGNNVANAATEGYHKQRINLSPSFSKQQGSVMIGGGVDVQSVSRIIDSLLEDQLLSQQALQGQTTQEYSTLATVEGAFGELTAGSGLNAEIDRFFGALGDLSAHPDEVIWQDQAVSAAQSLAGRFRTLSDSLSGIESQIRLEVENTVEQVNTLAGQIARLNADIQKIEISGAEANNLRDERDHLITQLVALIGVQTQQRNYGIVDVNVGGIPIVAGTSTIKLEVGLDQTGQLGLTPADSFSYETSVAGGRLGGLLTLKNNIVGDIHDDLDRLAAAVIQQINQLHVQGLGPAGSFTELTGQTVAGTTLADIENVTDGAIYIRVTNTSTGQVSRHKIDVDASSDTLQTIATRISAVTGLSASVGDSKLHILADTGYKFDFTPAVLSQPTASTLTGASPPAISVSGIYTGSTNQTFTFTVSGTGQLGNGTLQLEVTDGDGQAVTTLNLGSGYAAGDILTLGNGIKIALGPGDLVAGDTFEVDAFADTDTSGLLAAAGMNTFFTGTGASDIAVGSEIVSSPDRIATSLGPDTTDNANALRLAAVRDLEITGLDSLTPGEFYRRLVTDIGRQVNTKKMQSDNIDVVINSLKNQRSELSGVDINEQAAQMLVFEQMFQAMAKYLTTVQSSISTIMDML